MLINTFAQIVLITATATATASNTKVSALEKTVRVKVGDSVTFAPINYRIKLVSFKTDKTDCAVPGFNCGSGYNPDSTAQPVFETSVAKRCMAKTGSLPKECEVAYSVVGSDHAKYVDLKFHSVFAPCEKEPNVNNRNSCFLLATKNSIYKPPFDPKNCERIPPSKYRDSCIKEVNEKLQSGPVEQGDK